MPVIYTLIARPPDLILIDSTNPAHAGNFAEISKKILANISEAQRQEKEKVTFVFEGHTFNFHSERGLTFMVLCDEAYGRTRPFLFLKDIVSTFFLMFSGEETVLEGSIARSFQGVLLQKIKNYSAPPEGAAPSLSDSLASADSAAAASPAPDPGLTKMKLVKAELDSLASSAKQNIDKVISRGEAIENLVDRTARMHGSSEVFRRQSKKLNQKLWMENFKIKLLMALVIVCGLYLILAVYCGLDLKSCTA